ncbi:hypothetical protein BH09VER1_BH09VER1_53630 [soil metagenome]
MNEMCESYKSGAAGLSVSPGKLVKTGEPFEFSAGIAGRLTVRHAWRPEAGSVLSADMDPGKTLRWTGEEPGMYVAEFVGGGTTFRRSLAVVGSDWAVCQITVGAFTAEDFADTVHAAGLVANYYVNTDGEGSAADFTFSDNRWRNYEREFGDEIYPHVMAKDIGVLNPALVHHDANWDSLSVDEIVERLAFLQDWWEKPGYRPLDRIATYTPCNHFVEACRRRGIRVIHSVIPEQNWSDGEWAHQSLGNADLPVLVCLRRLPQAHP